MKEAGKQYLDEAFKAAGYSGTGDKRLDGTMGTVQVIQLGGRGSALYNCADIMFNSSAPLLGDDTCKNGTGVSGSAIENAGATATTEGNSTAATPKPNAAAGMMANGLGSALVAGVVAALMLV